MRFANWLCASALVALIVTTPCLVRAAIMGGRYPITGYFTQDRWGQYVVTSYPFVWFVSADAAKTLAGYKGKPVKIDADVEQPMNPGGAVINKIYSVSPIVFTDFSLEASAPQTVKQGAWLKLHLRVRNPLNKPMSLEPGHLEIVLVTQHPFSNDSIGYKSLDNTAYWYYEWSLWRERSAPVYQTAFHNIPLDWSPQRDLAHSRGVTLGERTPDFRPPGYFYPLVFQSQGKSETDVSIGHELPSGKYEAFFTMTGYEAGHLYPASPCVRFDVK